MNSDVSSFLRRARFFLVELKAKRYPNATTLQKFDQCSRPTAARFISRLQEEFQFPIQYDESERGYYLTDPDFSIEFLPPGKDEFSALFLIRQLAETVGSKDVQVAVASLWNSAVGNNRVHLHDIDMLASRFSADLTAVSTIADTGVIALLDHAAVGTPLALTYKSPWKHHVSKKYRGYIEKVHLSDGSVYVLFASDDGRELVLNASFIKTVEKLDTPPVIAPKVQTTSLTAWLDGFGIWANEKLVEVTVEIASPAAEFYAVQRWHSDQVDTWENDHLIRKMPAILSPELVRRILSLGRHVVAIDPPELQEMVRSELKLMAKNFG